MYFDNSNSERAHDLELSLLDSTSRGIISNGERAHDESGHSD